MSKKGNIMLEILLTIPRLIFLVIVLLFVVMLLRKYVVDTLDVQQNQADVFADRILYSQNGILYFDNELQTIIPGTVDPKLIKDENLNKLINYSDNGFISSFVELTDLSTKKSVVSAYYNKENYNRWVILTSETGEGAVNWFRKTTLVNYISDDGTKKQGMIKITMLLPGAQ